MKNLWELWERIWPGDTKNLSEKEKKDCVVDLMKVSLLFQAKNSPIVYLGESVHIANTVCTSSNARTATGDLGTV